MTTTHSFTAGGRYRNRSGDYEVLSIDGEMMTVRYDDHGGQATLKVEAQVRIWQNMLDDELAADRRSDFTGDDFTPGERLLTWPVRLLVDEVLQAHFAPPYPADITDRVCRAIAVDPDWLRRYHAAAAELGDSEHSAEWKVNNAIGGWVKALAGMVTVKKGVRTDNGLTKTYTRLGYAGQGE
jgi:hypothetical protein